MKRTLLYLFVQVLLGAVTASAQTDIQLSRYPAFDFRVSGIFDVNVLNASTEPKSGYLHGTIVKAINNQQVVRVVSSLVTLEPGMNVLYSSNMTKTFSQIDQYAQTTDKLGFGDHEICISFVSATGVEPEATGCYTITMPAISLPYLIYPYHESVLGDKHPNLMWSIPVIRQSLDVKYKLELVEQLAGQQPNDAMINNFRLVQTDLLPVNNLFYPPTAPELQYYKTYAWQVTTYIDQHEAGKTEVWAFTLVPDTFSIPENDIPVNYVILSDLNLEGIYTTRDKKLYLELDEKYVHEDISFTVYKEEALSTPVCNLADTRKTGINLFTLDFSNCQENLDKNVVYFLAVKSNNRVYKLKFRSRS